MKESTELNTLWQGYAVWSLRAFLTLIIWGFLTLISYFLLPNTIPVKWYLLGAGLLSVGVVAIFSRFIKKLK